MRVCATATGEQNGIKLQHKLIASNYQLKPIWYIYFRMTSLLQELPKIRETFGNLKTIVKGVNVLYFLRALMLLSTLRIEKKNLITENWQLSWSKYEQPCAEADVMPLSLHTIRRCDAQPIHHANWHSPITDLRILHAKPSEGPLHAARREVIWYSPSQGR